MGLVVAKQLVELMGGTIGVKSSVGTGSEFWIELIRDEAPQHSAVTTTDAESTPPARRITALRTLLYVEDNPANLLLVEHIIKGIPDIHMLSARDGKLGIELARAHLPDMILMDINLPGMSGIEALKILLVDPLTKHIPVVALSANAMQRDIERGLEAGFYRYLTKPIKINEFMNALDDALKYSKLTQSSQMKQEE
jgi:CheY-like chemotaxis protein